MKLDKIVQEILESKKICITNHVSPDGDALGSALALYNILKKLNKDVYVIAREELPAYLSFLPGFEEVIINSDSILSNTDCIVVLDCGNVERINANFSIESDEYKIINIDHHISNDMYGHINYVDSNAAAVGEIVFKLYENTNVEIDKRIAACIYTAILTDTGSFRYPSTSEETHRIAGELVKTGINFTEIFEKIYDNKSYNKIKLYGKVIDTIKLELNGKVSFVELFPEDVIECGAEDEDTGDLLGFGTKIKGVEVTVFIKEKKDMLKVSLRSKKYVDVRKIAETYGGGGHVRAAGFSTYLKRDELKNQLIKKISEELN